MTWPFFLAAGWLLVASLSIAHGLEDPIVAGPLAAGFVVGAWELLCACLRARKGMQP